ncbi:DUF1439 domain-containing protein [Aquincola sp. MAHUQ-54]|uniref:DUF1439 domain-containing protein n=1 Tax=Aquincola agrisoli TaxID=3119538 RepID=A0AAW9QBZ4_9BURK
MAPRHPRRFWIAAMVAAAITTGCMPLGLPRTIVITEAQLQEKLAEHFPVQQRLMAVLDIEVQRPQVRLLPERGRVAAVLNVDATERLSRKRLRGRLDADSQLRFDPRDMALKLSGVRVSTLDVQDAGGNWPAPLHNAALLLAEQLLEGQVVWRASASQAERLARLGVQAVDVQVTSRGIEITLDAAAAGALPD